jgi:hypothetical protein
MPTPARYEGYAPRKQVEVHVESLAEAGRPVADALIDPAASAAFAIRALLRPCDVELLDLPSLVEALKSNAKAVEDGTMSGTIQTLTTQSTVLNMVFVRLIQRAMASQDLTELETYFRLAFRAQSLSRATLEALMSDRTSTNVAFLGHTNFVNGPQQVNNQMNLAKQTNGHSA